MKARMRLVYRVVDASGKPTGAWGDCPVWASYPFPDGLSVVATPTRWVGDPACARCKDRAH